MSPAPAALGVPVWALNEWRSLTTALDDTTAPIPCQGTRSAEWHGSSGRELEFATRACLDCPVMVACARYAIPAGEDTGVWGGLTPRERSARKGGAR